MDTIFKCLVTTCVGMATICIMTVWYRGAVLKSVSPKNSMTATICMGHFCCVEDQSITANNRFVDLYLEEAAIVLLTGSLSLCLSELILVGNRGHGLVFATDVALHFSGAITASVVTGYILHVYTSTLPFCSAGTVLAQLAAAVALFLGIVVLLMNVGKRQRNLSVSSEQPTEKTSVKKGHFPVL